jgi:cytidylate kinase
MSTKNLASVAGPIRLILGAVKTAAVPLGRASTTSPKPPQPFITISRQAWTGATTLSRRLVERLNQIDLGETPWTSWDRELVEKVAADHQISQRLIESLGTSSRSWLTDFLAGFSFDVRAHPSEEMVYKRVAATIRALAQVGRVVLVGRGAVLVTHNMPGGIHIRLVAPLEYRVNYLMNRRGLSHKVALDEVRELDRSREAFYHRYWPGASLAPETFALTLNMAYLNEEQVVDCLLPLLRPVNAAVGRI